MSREIALWWTLKKTLIVVVLLHFLICGSVVSEAANPSGNASEDTVSESVWDWLTTLGKSSQEKKDIKNDRRLARDKKRIEEERRIRENELQRQNEANIKEEERMRDARIRAKQKRIKQKKTEVRKRKKKVKK